MPTTKSGSGKHEFEVDDALTHRCVGVKSNYKILFVYFQIFFLVVVFALYNGLVFLPVLLSLVGPASMAKPKEDKPGNARAANGEAPKPVEMEEMSPLNA